ncbi:hypothetical protein XELAEV_18026792mg [Xenopus laevis]|uniref:Consortin C-terminal domain-containing protein n=1 Tax=Xenopus laevis TaxID=8355 RepID=A0A974CWM7_XENLA|nr:hypothetical protein XELAEV_18026792mg [Xenopus laevis]
MNPEETSLDLLQTSVEGNLKVQDEVCYPDENENKVDSEKDETFTRKEEITLQKKDAQDSLNNNENCHLMCGQLSCKKGCEDGINTTGESLSTAALTSKDATGARGKLINNKRSNRRFSSADAEISQESKSTEPSLELDTPNPIAEENKETHLRNTLFSIIQEEFEWAEDLKMLPMCLHQIAETYFQEEDYEKAMQFIQLERIYHQQLLANLSSIQEQWEAKWKKTECPTPPSSEDSEKGLSSTDLEKLSKLCKFHEEPKISKHKLSPSEKSLRIQSLLQLMRLEETHGVYAPTFNSDRESRTGNTPSKGRAPAVTTMTENSPSSVRTVDDISIEASHEALPRLDHMEEQPLCSMRVTTEAHTQSTGTVGRANATIFSAGDAGKNNNLLQPEAIPLCKNVLGLETVSREPEEEHPGKHELISTSAASADCISVTHDDLSGMRSNLDCNKAVQPEQVTNNTEELCTAEDDEDLSVKKGNAIAPDGTKGEALESPEYIANQETSPESEREAQRRATVEFIANFLNGDLRDSEHFLSQLDFQEEPFSEEEMSPSPGESILGENFISLDELAKRIEVEEVSPAAGLVSILKRRSQTEGINSAQTSQKQTKRKVRFQETEDTLDQEEIGGGSCILLILLCIATVFLSIGGTALYCTFGDIESSVCKDFTANMDFYYTQLLQGIEELKHWLYVT